MTVLEFIAAIALLINDLLAVFSILGSALILVMAVVNVALSRKCKVPDQVWMWG